MLTKTFDTKGTMSAAPGERAVVARISTISVDRDGDVMLPSGVDVSDFKTNPVVLFGHDANSIPVGSAVAITTTPNEVRAKVLFAKRPKSLPKEQEWPADTILDLFKQGVLRAFSVGFQIEKAREADKKDAARFGPRVRRVISSWKLLEFSIVPIPANQDALAMAVSKGYCERHSWIHQRLTTERSRTSKVFRLDEPKPFRMARPFRVRVG